MTPNPLFILIAALLAGMQMSRRGCPACVLLPKMSVAAPGTDSNSTTPRP